MKLCEGEIGHTYMVYSVMVNEAVTRRLEALGVNELTPVVLMNKKGSGTVMIKVRGTRLALGRKISEGIEIREVRGHGGRKEDDSHWSCWKSQLWEDNFIQCAHGCET